LRGNCLLKHVIEGKIEEKIEVMGRRGRRCKQLLVDLKRKHTCWKWRVTYIALSGGLALEEAMDLS
jgi:hypothetical protein